jgi:hypothetical protein
MALEENWKKRTDFVARIRKDLIPLMESMGYALSFDNESLSKDDSNRWVFKLVFKGPKTIEVSNDDWRDYTEYFHFYVDSKNVFTVNIYDYDDLNKAYNASLSSLESYLN